MATSTLNLGAEVYSADGKKVGIVRHFFSAAPPSSGTSTAEGESVPEATALSSLPDDGIMPGLDDTPRSAWTPGPGSGVALGASDTKYCEIHHGGHFHIGGESFYVPFSAISVIEEDGSVILRSTADEVVAQYSRKPAASDAE